MADLRYKILENARKSVADDLRLSQCKNKYAFQRERQRAKRWRALVLRERAKTRQPRKHPEWKAVIAALGIEGYRHG
jgi:hypothetical protein